MDYIQKQKYQIDEEARKAKEEADRKAVEERQTIADQEAERIRQEAEVLATQIQADAQK
jgi:hypothetical protein